MRTAVATMVTLTLCACLSGWAAAPQAAPPFPSQRTQHWLGAPQSWEALRGRVVLLDVWTFG